MKDVKDILKTAQKNKKSYLDSLMEALQIPSVTSDKEATARMANWLLNYLGQELKFKTKKIKTCANPLVYAESPKVEGAPIVLVYGHYDVQPADPINEWKTPPFEPKIRGGNIYGRGTADDKGQFLTHVFAVKAWQETRGKLPLQIKFLFEGNEEAGSEGLSEFLKKEENLSLLLSDVILVSDTSMAGPDLPSINYGLRGVIGFDLILRGPTRDVHSGVYGGSIYNPAIALSHIMSDIIDAKGVIRIPGFYDDVKKLTTKERALLAELPFNEKESLAEIGLIQGFGDPKYSPLEQRGVRPSFDINGLISGYQGKGGKTIIPAYAEAKFTFRIVPDQTPEKIRQCVENFIQDKLPSGITMELEYQQGAGGMVIDYDGKFVQLAAQALEETFGHKACFTREGGSIPIVTEMKDRLKTDVVLAGFGLNEDGIHSPNERFGLKNFYAGIETSVRIMEKFGDLKTDEISPAPSVGAGSINDKDPKDVKKTKNNKNSKSSKKSQKD